MSYVRFGTAGSDVYVYEDIGGYINCCGCVLQERRWVDDPDYPFFKGYLAAVGEIVPHAFTDIDALEAHLDRHRAAGHHVPDFVMRYVREDFPNGYTAPPENGTPR